MMFSVILFSALLSLCSGQTTSSFFTTTTLGESSWLSRTTISNGRCLIADPSPFGNGNWSYVRPAAIDSSIFGNAQACGMCILLTGSDEPVPPTSGSLPPIPPNAEPMILYVVDECLNNPNCHGNVGPGFALYTPNAPTGTWYTNWTAIECPTSGVNISYLFSGSDENNLNLHIRAHSVPVSGVTYFHESGPITMTRTATNQFQATNLNPPATSPVDIAIESIFGEVVNASIVVSNFSSSSPDMNGLTILQAVNDVQFSASGDGAPTNTGTAADTGATDIGTTDAGPTGTGDAGDAGDAGSAGDGTSGSGAMQMRSLMRVVL